MENGQGGLQLANLVPMVSKLANIPNPKKVLIKLRVVGADMISSRIDLLHVPGYHLLYHILC